MARIVLISPYLKGGQNTAKLMYRTRYVPPIPAWNCWRLSAVHSPPQKGLLDADAHVNRFGNVFFAPQ